MTGKRLLFLIAAVFVTTAVAASLLAYNLGIKSARGTGEIYIEGDEYEKLLQYFELDDVKDVIQESYYTELEEAALTIGALKGMVEALGDGYSRFYEKEDFQYFDAKSEGSYIGQGMMLRRNAATGYAEVSKVFADTPAFEANILEGDLVLSIDGRDTRDIDIDNAVSRLRGVDGTKLVLKVNSSGTEAEVEITRKSPEIQVAFMDMLEDVAYVDVVEFSQNCVEDFKSVVEAAKAEEATGMIIDLRGNPGGNVSQAAEACDLLLSSGRICYTMGKSGEGTTWTADGNTLWDKAIVVLVDGETQGAAEIFAAALQGNSRATIVGQQTVGKGVALSFFPIGAAGDGVKLVTAEYYSPTGQRISAGGVTPDIIVANAAEGESSAEEDAILQKANEVIAGQM